MATTQEVLVGFAIAIAIGFFFGLLVGETAFGERAVMPYLVAVNAMPKVAFAPLFVSWLRFGIASKVALSAFIAFFPVIVAQRPGCTPLTRMNLCFSVPWVPAVGRHLSS